MAGLWHSYTHIAQSPSHILIHPPNCRLELQDLYSLCVNDKEVHRDWAQGKSHARDCQPRVQGDDWWGFDVVSCCVLLFISDGDGDGDGDDDDDDDDDG